MHVAILGMNYAPEPTGIGPYSADLAEFLAERGDRVDVFTAFPHYPEWHRMGSYDRACWLSTERRNGVTVHRGWVILPRRKAASWRILYDSSILCSVVSRLPTIMQADLFLAVSPPLQLAAAAVILGRVARRPVVLVIKDLVPEAALSVGMMRRGSTAIIYLTHLPRERLLSETL